MDDHLQQQLVNELRAVLQPINETYKDFFHIQLITLCDMKELSCNKCNENEVGQKCMRCVIGFEEVSKQ
jgi:hypothetical protein